MQTFTFTIPVHGKGMALYVAMPDATASSPAIVVIQHAPGVDTFIHSIVDRLAEAGYAAVAPDLYHRLDPRLEGKQKREQLKDPEIIADVNATVDFMLNRELMNSDRLGITGFCMGGRVVYLMAAANPHFKAAVAYYGGNIMVPWGGDVEAPFARTAEIQCPLLFHFGAEDTNPSPEDMQQLDEALTEHGKVHEFHVYEGAAHAFMNFANAGQYREESAHTSWSRTVRFFEEQLRSD